jgi:hypothetical protein
MRRGYGDARMAGRTPETAATASQIVPGLSNAPSVTHGDGTNAAILTTTTAHARHEHRHELPAAGRRSEEVSRRCGPSATPCEARPYSPPSPRRLRARIPTMRIVDTADITPYYRLST